MAGQTRQRSAAQRREKSGEGEIATAEIIDEQVQDKEIKQLRAKNASDNQQAQNALDVGIVTCFFIAGIQLFNNINKANSTLAILALMQAVLLPLSLTPHWLSSVIPPKKIPVDLHLYLLSIHLGIAGCGVYLRLAEDGLAYGSGGVAIPFNEIARWTLPALAVLGVEVQRKAERTAEEKLRLLEGLKYNLKGA